MSGLEVGFGVLGILPLIVSAADHYNKCHQLFRNYRNVTAEVDLFQEQLQTQKTIFRTECLLLLDNVCPKDAASAMLGERSHPLWADKATEQQLAGHLNESKAACVATIKRVGERLKDVETKCEGLTEVLNNPDISSRRRRAKKLKHAFSKSQLEQDLSALRTLNEDFRVLASQTDLIKKRGHLLQKSVPQTHKEVERIGHVRMAAQQLYDALGRACTKHTVHTAHFNLHVEAREASDGDNCSAIKFQLALRQTSLVGHHQGDASWLIINSILQDSSASTALEPSAQLDHLGMCLKRELVTREDCADNSSTKRVRFASSPSTMLPSPLSETLSNSAPSAPIMRRNLCDYLRKYFREDSNSSNACIGILETTQRCKHLVYPLQATHRCSDKPGISLNGFLTSLSKQKVPNGFLPFERLCLAKSLAVAVLHYHATPWLRVPWRSQDILFFNGRTNPRFPPERDLDLSAPHLNVKVTGSDDTAGHVIQKSRSIVQDPILFRLGVVLLEIAYSAPLPSLQQPCDLEDGIEGAYTEFFTAQRLANSIGRELGPSYGKIVRKLLRCNFGCDDDFSSQDLQAVYYNDVVCELDRLEQGFRQLQIG